MRDLCYGCKQFKDIVYQQPGTDSPFCETCQMEQPLTSDEWALVMLATPGSPIGPPFRPGDKVEARQVMASDGTTIDYRYEGVGEVVQVSMSLEHGGTPVYPAFRVIFSEKAHNEAPDEFWYPEACLSLVGK